MASSMFESVLGTITPEMTQSLASRFADSTSAIQQGLSEATAVTLNGLAKNSRDPSFTDQVMQTVSRAGSLNIAANAASIAAAGPSGASGDVVNRFSSLVFGSQQRQLAQLVSEHSGTSRDAGSELLKSAAGLVLGHLARMHSTGSLNSGTLASTLRSGGSNLTSHFPSGFPTSLGGTVSGAADRTSGYVSNVIHTRGPRQPSARSASWIIPVAAVAIGAALLGWLVSHQGYNTRPSAALTEIPRNTGPSTAVTEMPPNAGPATTIPGAEGPSLGNQESVSLPDGTEISVPSGGVEARLVGYLQNPTAQVSEVTWFDFDRLVFDTDQATLQPQSNEQLDNVAAIMKAYPSVKIRVGGYTDNTGDPNANRKLSEERANSVMAALTQRGVDPSRLSAHGYGDQSPVADNSTSEGRQQNRRISIRVAEK
jgi:outer membrane protein OmpA-like peptidoglycan-associated protein